MRVLSDLPPLLSLNTHNKVACFKLRQINGIQIKARGQGTAMNKINEFNAKNSIVIVATDKNWQSIDSLPFDVHHEPAAMIFISGV